MTDVILYWDTDFQGESLSLHSSDADLSNDYPYGLWPFGFRDPFNPFVHGWDNQVSSIKVSGGDVELYDGTDYTDPLKTLGPGQYSSLDFNDSISSVFIPGNLIKNGSFETGPEPGAYLPLGPGSKDITDWTVIQSESSPPGLQGAIDYVGTDWNDADGSRSLDLNGTPGVGGVLQEFDTRPDQQYHVSFDMAGHPSGLPQDMRVSADGQSEIFHFDSKTDPKNLEWEPMSWDFTAHSNRTTLAFESLQTDYLYGGPALDNVAVVDVTPATSSQTEPKPTTTTPPTTTITPPSPPPSTPEFVRLGGIAR